MKQNSWENTRNHQYYGPNTPLGSPKGWLQRAIGANQAELGLHSTSLDPKQITVAGIWRRGETLPDTGTWSAIYRFFHITDDLRRMGRAKNEDFYPVLGMAVAVPEAHVFEAYQQFRRTAQWVWWSLPQSTKSPAKPMKELDHQQLYDLFEQGKTVQEVARDLRLLVNSVHYVYQKWQAGLPAVRKSRSRVDHDSVAQDLRMGVSVTELSQRYDVSRTAIYKIKQAHKIK